jgi:hypothetical protein
MNKAERDHAESNYNEHIDQVRKERAVYAYRKHLPVSSNDSESLNQYLVLGVDGSDQGAYGFPHFVGLSKDDECMKLYSFC